MLPPGEWDPSIRIEPPASVPSQENRRLQQESNGKKNGVGAKANGIGGAGGDEGDGGDNKELVRTGRCVMCTLPPEFYNLPLKNF